MGFNSVFKGLKTFLKIAVEVQSVAHAKVRLGNSGWDMQADACSFLLLHGTEQKLLNDWGPYALVQRCYYSYFLQMN